MIVRTKPLKIKLKETQNPFEDFKQISNNDFIHREVLFTRYIGIPHSIKLYTEKILEIDQYFSSSMSVPPYLRLHGLERIVNKNDINRLSNIWNSWKIIIEHSNIDSYSLYQTPLGVHLESDTLEWTKKLAFKDILSMYKKNHPHSSETSFNNFAIKLLHWMEIYLPKLFDTSRLSPKVVFIGDIKQHELLFLLLLFKLGCDIFYLNPKEDIINLYPEIGQYSTLYKCNRLFLDKLTIPDFSSISNKEHPLMTKGKTANSLPKIANNAKQSKNKAKVEEYSYEQLANLSSSVVMIKNYDNQGNVLCYGSGVVIHSSGYILTNLHVIAGGCFFSVLYENETHEYKTDNFIKYHQQYDLAIIKVDKKCSPLAVKADGRLVRGQKIVAIGSPLGLFNSVSDGIVSGFRDIDSTPMIQFTAPISNGSSGGALLDMYGRLVGLITAGFNEGQNLNLAIPSEKIYLFAQNFIEHS